MRPGCTVEPQSDDQHAEQQQSRGDAEQLTRREKARGAEREQSEQTTDPGGEPVECSPHVLPGAHA